MSSILFLFLVKLVDDVCVRNVALVKRLEAAEKIKN